MNKDQNRLSTDPSVSRCKSGGERLELTKVEKWNSVRVTCRLPAESVSRLQALAREQPRTLRALGVLSVHVQGLNTVVLLTNTPGLGQSDGTFQRPGPSIISPGAQLKTSGNSSEPPLQRAPSDSGAVSGTTGGGGTRAGSSLTTGEPPAGGTSSSGPSVVTNFTEETINAVKLSVMDYLQQQQATGSTTAAPLTGFGGTTAAPHPPQSPLSVAGPPAPSGFRQHHPAAATVNPPPPPVYAPPAQTIGQGSNQGGMQQAQQQQRYAKVQPQSQHDNSGGGVSPHNGGGGRPKEMLDSSDPFSSMQGSTRLPQHHPVVAAAYGTQRIALGAQDYYARGMEQQQQQTSQHQQQYYDLAAPHGPPAQSPVIGAGYHGGVPASPSYHHQRGPPLPPGPEKMRPPPPSYPYEPMDPPRGQPVPISCLSPTYSQRGPLSRGSSMPAMGMANVYSPVSGTPRASYEHQQQHQDGVTVSQGAGGPNPLAGMSPFPPRSPRALASQPGAVYPPQASYAPPGSRVQPQQAMFGQQQQQTSGIADNSPLLVHLLRSSSPGAPGEVTASRNQSQDSSFPGTNDSAAAAVQHAQQQQEVFVGGGDFGDASHDNQLMYDSATTADYGGGAFASGTSGLSDDWSSLGLADDSDMQPSGSTVMLGGAAVPTSVSMGGEGGNGGVSMGSQMMVHGPPGGGGLMARVPAAQGRTSAAAYSPDAGVMAGYHHPAGPGGAGHPQDGAGLMAAPASRPPPTKKPKRVRKKKAPAGGQPPDPPSPVGQMAHHPNYYDHPPASPYDSGQQHWSYGGAASPRLPPNTPQSPGVSPGGAVSYPHGWLSPNQVPGSPRHPSAPGSGPHRSQQQNQPPPGGMGQPYAYRGPETPQQAHPGHSHYEQSHQMPNTYPVVATYEAGIQNIEDYATNQPGSQQQSMARSPFGGGAYLGQQQGPPPRFAHGSMQQMQGGSGGPGTRVPNIPVSMSNADQQLLPSQFSSPSRESPSSSSSLRGCPSTGAHFHPSPGTPQSPSSTPGGGAPPLLPFGSDTRGTTSGYPVHHGKVASAVPARLQSQNNNNNPPGAGGGPANGAPPAGTGSGAGGQAHPKNRRGGTSSPSTSIVSQETRDETIQSAIAAVLSSLQADRAKTRGDTNSSGSPSGAGTPSPGGGSSSTTSSPIYAQQQQPPQLATSSKGMTSSCQGPHGSPGGAQWQPAKRQPPARKLTAAQPQKPDDQAMQSHPNPHLSRFQEERPPPEYSRVQQQQQPQHHATSHLILHQQHHQATSLPPPTPVSAPPPGCHMTPGAESPHPYPPPPAPTRKRSAPPTPAPSGQTSVASSGANASNAPITTPSGQQDELVVNRKIIKILESVKLKNGLSQGGGTTASPQTFQHGPPHHHGGPHSAGPPGTTCVNGSPMGGPHAPPSENPHSPYTNLFEQRFMTAPVARSQPSVTRGGFPMMMNVATDNANVDGRLENNGPDSEPPPSGNAYGYLRSLQQTKVESGPSSGRSEPGNGSSVQ